MSEQKLNDIILHQAKKKLEELDSLLSLAKPSQPLEIALLDEMKGKLKEQGSLIELFGSAMKPEVKKEEVKEEVKQVVQIVPMQEVKEEISNQIYEDELTFRSSMINGYSNKPMQSMQSNTSGNASGNGEEKENQYTLGIPYNKVDKPYMIFEEIYPITLDQSSAGKEEVKEKDEKYLSFCDIYGGEKNVTTYIDKEQIMRFIEEKLKERGEDLPDDQMPDLNIYGIRLGSIINTHPRFSKYVRY
jgi:hypothetical protein